MVICGSLFIIKCIAQWHAESIKTKSQLTVSNKSPGSKGFEKYKPGAYIRDNTVCMHKKSYSLNSNHFLAGILHNLLGNWEGHYRVL